MSKKSAFLLLATITLAACTNNRKVDVADGTSGKSIDTLTYTMDSVKIYSKNIIKTDSTSDTTKATVTYPLFKNAALNAYIKRQVFDFIAKEETATSYQDIAKSFVSGYDSFYASNKDRQQAWWLDIAIKVLHQAKAYIALKYVNADYAGGAHPNYYISYINFDPIANKPITLDSLILAGQKPKLVKVAEAIFRKDEKLSPTEPLEERYFFDKGRFSLPESFYIDRTGLVFLYNPYEIKPYVSGTTTLIVPFQQLKGIARPGSILNPHN